jgi:hypothetical protein
MADDQVSKNGVWIDSKTGNVVESQPEEGIQLVPAGGTIDNATQQLIDTANAAATDAPKTEKSRTRS